MFLDFIFEHIHILKQLPELSTCSETNTWPISKMEN